MAKDIKYRIKKEWTAYSKKKGAHLKSCIIQKGINSYEDAEKLLRDWYKGGEFLNDGSFFVHTQMFGERYIILPKNK